LELAYNLDVGIERIPTVVRFVGFEVGSGVAMVEFWD
jgi:hypothetical protein